MTDQQENTRQGVLIAFEGIDGTGKSTQIRLLAEALEKSGQTVVATREPTSGKYGKRIRELYLNRETVSHEEELELFIADRREHVRDVIRPALLAGNVVLTDRYYLSTAAYQGALGHDPEKILTLNEAFAPEPDLVLMIMIPPSVGVHRIRTLRNETLNTFEQESGLEKVAAVYDSIEREYIRRIDGAGNIAEVHERVMLQVRDCLGKRILTPVS